MPPEKPPVIYCRPVSLPDGIRFEYYFQQYGQADGKPIKFCLDLETHERLKKSQALADAECERMEPPSDVLRVI